MSLRPHLPRLIWHPTEAKGSRHGAQVRIVVVHRWGVRFGGGVETAREYAGVVDYFSVPSNNASAHIVFPGSAVAGEATQMVSWAEAAWAEAADNPIADDIESADAIWLGHDPAGLRVLARIVASRLRDHGLPPHWSISRGFCRHADLGAAGGGHLECPTTDLALWGKFRRMVWWQYRLGGFRSPWGR